MKAVLENNKPKSELSGLKDNKKEEVNANY